MKKILLVVLMLVAGAFVSVAQAAAPVEGKDYIALNPPMPVQTGKKIEVIEFFYYGCPHCYDLEPHLNKWVKTLPADVAFRRVPAIFRQNWEPLARTFYTLEALGELERMHTPVFDTIHLDGLNLSDEKVMSDYIARNNIDRKKFADAYKSFAIQSKVAQAKQWTQQYKITGTPALVVDGRYLTSNSMTGSHESVALVLDKLVERARKERKDR